MTVLLANLDTIRFKFYKKVFVLKQLTYSKNYFPLMSLLEGDINILRILE